MHAMPPILTLPYPETPTSDSRVLVIGHDPRLRDSGALAQHALFADLFFQPVPGRASEHAKYELANAVFAYIGELTSYRYTARQLVLTNLCNGHLPHAPKGHVVFIPEKLAAQGLAEIRHLIRKARIELIFAMSEQVNYWLQALGFCTPKGDYLHKSAPKERGMNDKPPFYEPRAPRAFQSIAFRRHETDLGIPLYPIIHVRSWPLKGPFQKAYGRLYSNCVSELKQDGA
jgi:hypothetical protein